MDAKQLDNLPDDVATLKLMLAQRDTTLAHRDATIAQQHEAIDQLQREKDKLAHRMDLLLRRVYGRTSERIDPNQLLLFGQRMAQAGALTEAAQQSQSAAHENEQAGASGPPRKGHGRRALPANLPRHRVEHLIEPAQVICPCCHGQRQRIGHTISEQLDYVPASLFVIEHVRGKYACRKCEEGGVAIAQRSPQSQVIEKGLPGPGVVTQVIVSKFVDHLPLYRQERIFARHGVELARSTMCGWMAQAAQLLDPLVKLMAQRVKQSKVIHTDDTPVPVQQKGAGKTRTGRFWVYLGDAAQPYIVYDYTPTRSRDGPVKWLANYTGYLLADAYAGYDEIYRSGKVIEVGCWAHARRKFFEAGPTDVKRSLSVLTWIRQLYAIEKTAKEMNDDQRAAMRQAQAAPILKQLHEYLLTQRDQVLPQSPMGEAITYALNQWNALTRYTNDGCLAIDNNTAERAIRPLAIGRKNYLFVGSDTGGHTAATLYSIVTSAKRAGLDIWLYLRDLLTRMPSAPLSQLPDFLPDRWCHPAIEQSLPEQCGQG